MASTGEMIGARFESQPNALNFLRLCFALEVLAWHAFGLRGPSSLPDRVGSFFGGIGVDAFFAISGFLICRAWCRRPHIDKFLLARARRILPGLWVCLAVTAFLIAPLAALVSGTTMPSLSGRWLYVWHNMGVWVGEWSIDGTPTGLESGAWNGALWSLPFEGICYLIVALMGGLQLVRPRIVLLGVAAIWVLNIIPGATANPLALQTTLLRTWLIFGCGAALYLYRDRIPASRALGAAAALVIIVGSLTPDYRVVIAPALAYLCIYAGLALGRHRRLMLHEDLSYGVYIYGFPVQQALLLCGVTLGWAEFFALSIASVVPLAALSWFVVERPALHRSRRAERETGITSAPSMPAPVG